MLVIAHRGASGNAPENTMAAFRKAVALGATFIETDLQLSRDARFVAIHDATVNRTTNGQGAVHDMTLAELRRLDAGSWFGSEFVGEDNWVHGSAPEGGVSIFLIGTARSMKLFRREKLCVSSGVRRMWFETRRIL